MHVRQAPIGAVVADRQASVIDAEQMQNGRVQIVAGQRLDGAPAPLVAFSVGHAALDAGAGEPGDRRAAVVIAPLGALAERMPAELGAEDDQRVLEQASLLEILQQGGDRLIDLLGHGRQFSQDAAVPARSERRVR